jgi:hypothetical protein
MKAFQPFTMERMMSRYEQTVEYNLTESGVYPIPLRELLMDHPDSIDLLLDTALNYPHANGNPELRENIAALYPGAGPDHVLVTVAAQLHADLGCREEPWSEGRDVSLERNLRLGA